MYEYKGRKFHMGLWSLCLLYGRNSEKGKKACVMRFWAGVTIMQVACVAIHGVGLCCHASSVRPRLFVTHTAEDISETRYSKQVVLIS